MISTKLHWVDGPGVGGWRCLRVRGAGTGWTARSRTRGLRVFGTVFSLLTPEEERDLEITAESTIAMAHGTEFRSFPTPDRQTPESFGEFPRALGQNDSRLEAGVGVVIHCRRELAGRAFPPVAFR